MSLPVSTLTVTRFRSLRNLTVGPFGRVNLITGKNNTSKTTLLEAIRILVSDGAPGVLLSVQHDRGEPKVSGYELPVLQGDSPWFSSLFSDFPNLSNCGKPFIISNSSGSSLSPEVVEVSAGWFARQVNETGHYQLVPVDEEELGFIGDEHSGPFLEVKALERARRFRLDGRRGAGGRVAMVGIDEMRTPCVYISPFSPRFSSNVGALWDRIVLTAGEKSVLKTLQILVPDLDAISMIGNAGDTLSRTVIAKSRKFHAPVPLRTFGDGVNRLFGMVLSLVNAADGVLLVDEIENGLHYSILPEVWKILFRMAGELNVQIFATTHSWDCVDSFQQAANEHPETGVLTRLTASNDRIIPTLFSEDELRIAARDQIEVR